MYELEFFFYELKIHVRNTEDYVYERGSIIIRIEIFFLQPKWNSHNFNWNFSVFHSRFLECPYLEM